MCANVESAQSIILKGRKRGVLRENLRGVPVGKRIHEPQALANFRHLPRIGARLAGCG